MIIHSLPLGLWSKTTFPPSFVLSEYHTNTIPLSPGCVWCVATWASVQNVTVPHCLQVHCTFCQTCSFCLCHTYITLNSEFNLYQQNGIYMMNMEDVWRKSIVTVMALTCHLVSFFSFALFFEHWTQSRGYSEDTRRFTGGKWIQSLIERTSWDL